MSTVAGAGAGDVAPDPGQQALLASDSAARTMELGRLLGACLRGGDIVLLSGDLGAGKTCLTQGIGAGLGVDSQVVSPTFVFMQVHAAADGRVLQHFDLYRLEHSEELEDIDYWGLLEGPAISVVEWGDQFTDALPTGYLLVRIAVLDGGARALECRAVGERSRELLADWTGRL